MSPLVVRRERPADIPAVQVLTRDAFGQDLERDLLAALRADEGWLPALSLVAERDGEVVGHVVVTRGDVSGVPAVGLGPISVLPALQRSGVGSALVHVVCAVAEASGESLAVLLGEPAYYARFGFVAASSVDVLSPDPAWGDAFQARRLRPDAPTGSFAYAMPFRRL